MYFRVGNKPSPHPCVLFVSEPGQQPVTIALSELPVPRHDFVRLVIISDTHERHRLVQLPAGDVFFHCGDILMSSSLPVQSRGTRVLEDFNRWLEDLPFPEKVVIGGNHDTSIKLLGSRAQELLRGAVLLQDSRADLPLSGLAVYGNAYSEGSSHNEAWQSQMPIVSTACEGVDIVVTHHCTPSIKAAVLACSRPRIWASGHCHDSHGVHEDEGTLYVNAAIQDCKYRPLQYPVVVDLPRERAVG